MPPYQADSAALPRPTGDRGTSYHLALAAFADDVVGTLARLFAYGGTLALLAILGLAALEQLPRLGDGQLGDGQAAAFGSILTVNDPCDPANQVNFPTRLARYAVARRQAVEPGGVAGQKGQACPADWLRDPQIVQLRGAL
jgi:hypothetical protein